MGALGQGYAPDMVTTPSCFQSISKELLKGLFEWPLKCYFERPFVGLISVLFPVPVEGLFENGFGEPFEVFC